MGYPPGRAKSRRLLIACRELMKSSFGSPSRGSTALESRRVDLFRSGSLKSCRCEDLLFTQSASGFYPCRSYLIASHPPLRNHSPHSSLTASDFQKVSRGESSFHIKQLSMIVL